MSRLAIPLILVLSLLPAPAHAEELFLADVELGAVAPLAAPDPGLGWGVAFSGAVMVAFERWLLPSLRIEALTLASGSLSPEQDIPSARRNGDLGMVITGGLRFRPRGLFHPGEPSAASCIWAEVNAGVMIGLSPRVQLALEGAIGFLFDLGDVDLGPYVRVTHGYADPSEHLLFSFGLELMLFDVATER